MFKSNIDKISKSNEIVRSVRKAINKRLTTPIYGIFLVSWLIFNWEFIFTMFFVSEEKILDKTGLLKHVYLHQTFFNYQDWTFWVWQIIPFIITYFVIWKFPKWIGLPAFKKEAEYEIEKRKVEIIGQRQLEEESVKKLEVTTQKAKKESEIKKIDPSISWPQEYKEFKRSSFSKELRYIMDSIYKFNGDIVSSDARGRRVFEIPKDILAYFHTNDLVSLVEDEEKIELTEKGKFFIRLFLRDINLGATKTEKGIIEDKTKDKANVALITCKIVSVLPDRISFNFLRDWKVWFLIQNHEKKKYKVHVKVKFISDGYEEDVKRGYYGGTKTWNLNALAEIAAPGLGIPKKIKEKARQKKKIEIRISCEIKDENDRLIEKKLPMGYVYDYENNNWYYEP